MPIKAFIFDMDDVLCRYDVTRRIARLAKLSGRSESDIAHAIWDGDYFARADRGEWSAGQCLTEFNIRLGYELTLDQWIDARRVAMTPFVDMLEFVRQLKAHMPVALLSNNDRLLAANLDRLFPAVRPLFTPHLYISAELDLAKPDPEIFRYLTTRLGIAPDEAVFVDDLEENIAGAKSAGLYAIRFSGFGDFIKALKSYDLPLALGERNNFLAKSDHSA